MFTTNIALWCFSFVTLFNLQGTRPVRLSGGTCSILPRQSALVKLFFLRLNFFYSRRWHDCRVSDSVITIPDSSHFVNYFFPGFFLILKNASISPLFCQISFFSSAASRLIHNTNRMVLRTFSGSHCHSFLYTFIITSCILSLIFVIRRDSCAFLENERRRK